MFANTQNTGGIKLVFSLDKISILYDVNSNGYPVTWKNLTIKVRLKDATHTDPLYALNAINVAFPYLTKEVCIECND